GAPALVCHLPPGARPHRRLHSVARSAGSGPCWSSFPRFADSPRDSVLSPAPRAPVFVGHLSPGSRTHRGLHSLARPAAPVFVDHSPVSRTHRGLHSVARSAGSGPCWSSFPRFADSQRDTFSRPLRGLRSLLIIFPPVRRLTGGYILRPLRGLGVRWQSIHLPHRLFAIDHLFRCLRRVAADGNPRLEAQPFRVGTQDSGLSTS